jgi:hypothetical protein
MICRIRYEEGWDEILTQCRRVHKSECINTKLAMMEQLGHLWVRKYDTCFYFYQQQAICGRGGARSYENLWQTYSSLTFSITNEEVGDTIKLVIHNRPISCFWSLQTSMRTSSLNSEKSTPQLQATHQSH